jgi:hypothetical protein
MEELIKAKGLKADDLIVDLLEDHFKEASTSGLK